MHHDRLGIEKIGDQRGCDRRCFDPFERDRDIRKDRRLDPAGEPLDRLIGAGLERDELALAATGARHLIEQPAIDAVADAEAEDPRGAGVRPYCSDDAAIVADVAIGQEDAQAYRRGGGCGREARLAHLQHTLATDGCPGPAHRERDAFGLEHARQFDRAGEGERDRGRSLDLQATALVDDGRVRHEHVHRAAIGWQVDEF